MNFDLTSWTGIAAGVLLLVSLVKTVLPKAVENREQIVSVLFGLVLGIAALTTHAMTFKPGLAGWVQAVLGGMSAGVAAQVAHDKGLNPIKAMFVKSPVIGGAHGMEMGDFGGTSEKKDQGGQP